MADKALVSQLAGPAAFQKCQLAGKMTVLSTQKCSVITSWANASAILLGSKVAHSINRTLSCILVEREGCAKAVL